ncbi:MAG: hypothetical protein NTW29_15500 [Bacteroidetes bacterium]|nr:hypothetical protein [Bacteroidota bacterium]
MKQLILLAGFILTAAISQAQTPRLVTAFNKLAAENRNHITIKKMNGKWMGHSGETEQQLSIKLNAAGTYLEIKDPGTGGGVTTFQMKIFRNNSGKEFIAYNKSWTDGAMYEGGMSFMDMNGNEASLQYWPDYEESLNFKPGESKEGNEDYFTGEYAYCNIPEAGNTIEVMPGYTAITGGCINEDPKACELKKKLVSKIVLVWSKEQDMFMPK